MKSTRERNIINWFSFISTVFAVFLFVALKNGYAGEVQDQANERVTNSLLQAGVSSALGIDSQYAREKILVLMIENPGRTKIALRRAIRIFDADFWKDAGSEEHYERFSTGTERMNVLAEALGLAYEMNTLAKDLRLSFRGKKLLGMHAQTVILLAQTYGKNIDSEANRQNKDPLDFRGAIDVMLNRRLDELKRLED